MPAGFTLELSYNQLLLLVMGLFMFIGAYRGLNQEFVTTVGLGVLLAVLLEPKLAEPIINYAAKLLRLILAFIQSRGSVDLKQLMSIYEKIKLPFDGKNPYALLIIVLVAFVLLSYSRRSSGKDLTALSRILGGLLGLLNGFLVVSLFKSYVIEYIKKRGGPAMVGIAAPPQFSVAVKDLPAGGGLAVSNWQFAAALLAILGAALLITTVTGAPLKKKKENKG